MRVRIRIGSSERGSCHVSTSRGSLRRPPTLSSTARSVACSHGRLRRVPGSDRSRRSVARRLLSLGSSARAKASHRIVASSLRVTRRVRCSRESVVHPVARQARARALASRRRRRRHARRRRRRGCTRARASSPRRSAEAAAEARRSTIRQDRRDACSHLSVAKHRIRRVVVGAKRVARPSRIAARRARRTSSSASSRRRRSVRRAPSRSLRVTRAAGRTVAGEAERIVGRRRAGSSRVLRADRHSSLGSGLSRHLRHLTDRRQIIKRRARHDHSRQLEQRVRQTRLARALVRHVWRHEIGRAQVAALRARLTLIRRAPQLRRRRVHHRRVRQRERRILSSLTSGLRSRITHTRRLIRVRTLRRSSSLVAKLAERRCSLATSSSRLLGSRAARDRLGRSRSRGLLLRIRRAVGTLSRNRSSRRVARLLGRLGRRIGRTHRARGLARRVQRRRRRRRGRRRRRRRRVW